MSHHDHAPEYMPGIPEPLPEGERLLWQGSPRWQNLAISALHVRKLVFYFALLAAWRIGSDLAGGQGAGAALAGAAGLAVPAGLAVGVLLLIAWQMGRTTIYTVTTERVMLRFGIALPMTANIPFSLVQSAAVKIGSDGSGDIPVTVKPGNGVSWLIFWPHVRPWSFGNAQPMLRGIPDAERVAGLLADALARYSNRMSGQTATRSPARSGERLAEERPADEATAGSFAAAAR
ncbi:photosynthetic complex putative assembly protein PuhB [Lentisalinibacter sediminis]|uniref:photosynthetic complex putative assembly protein PuhB n=1 Tax=Lentisalinibacter sediminis TaxID=2992237 RepID=UPI00386D1EC1